MDKEAEKIRKFIRDNRKYSKAPKPAGRKCKDIYRENHDWYMNLRKIFEKDDQNQDSTPENKSVDKVIDGSGQIAWHVALRPGTAEMQDVVVVRLPIDNLPLLSGLLGTNRLKGKNVETDTGNYLLMYGGEYQRPYPSIMIWKAIIDGDKNTLTDMGKEDASVVELVWRDWLMPENTTEVYSPPEAFMFMA